MDSQVVRALTGRLEPSYIYWNISLDPPPDTGKTVKKNGGRVERGRIWKLSTGVRWGSKGEGDMQIRSMKGWI